MRRRGDEETRRGEEEPRRSKRRRGEASGDEGPKATDRTWSVETAGPLATVPRFTSRRSFASLESIETRSSPALRCSRASIASSCSSRRSCSSSQSRSAPGSTACKKHPRSPMSRHNSRWNVERAAGRVVFVAPARPAARLQPARRPTAARGGDRTPALAPARGRSAGQNSRRFKAVLHGT